ncbi:hypothetical protein [Labilibaculum antarcticum]|uniref:Uncharacterized protein n=1 Tax=Labilibaculum antarcticum TaxID=1717717 RepID=A0A1Y1CQ02_9BACT|nr:hypothetical protein [Labilibaculum antarcticum]BAX82350.1 hypothetical protein ALGA_4059 [Labilibaculum antarcticum]
MKEPKPFCSNTDNIKAFVLGCDPTAFDKTGNRLEFEYVFDLGNDERYFKGVIDNLEQISLSIEKVYVQNLVTDYQKEETSKNKNWHQTAQEYIAIRKQEFDNLDPSGTTPVFLTSEVLYKVLINPDEKKYKASQLYNSPELLPIPAISNLLGRPLIPLYRHWNYNLKKWPQYSKLFKLYFD